MRAPIGPGPIGNGGFNIAVNVNSWTSFMRVASGLSLWRCRRVGASGGRTGTAREAMLAQAPDEHVDAILTEEGLARDDECRHAPVSRRLQRPLILLDE